jgi:hypothetical protein
VGELYRFKVKAYDEVSAGAISEILEYTHVWIPGAPSNLRETAQDDSSITVEWDAPTDFGGDSQIYYRVNIQSDELNVSPDGLTDTFVKLENIEMGRDYRITVRAQNSFTLSEESDEIIVQIKKKIPEAPIGLVEIESNRTVKTVLL